jgi:hypothetical protein
MKAFQPGSPSALRSVLALLILTLCACEQSISQQTNVPPPIVNVTVNTAPSPTPRPTARPASPRPASPMPTPRPSATPTLPSIDLNPITGPQLPDETPPGLDKFLTSIPDPELTRDYDTRAGEMALALWTRRYNDGRQDPYHVLKMYLDAGLIAGENEALAASLNRPIMHSQTPLLFPEYARLDAEAVAKAKPFAIRSYYRGTSEVNSYALPDFEARIVNVVSKTSSGGFKQLSVPDVRKQAPESPRYGEKVKYLLYSSARKAEAEVTLIYDNGGWKINFWTPNVLVLFLS